MLVASFYAADELVDGGGLVASRLVGAAELEFHSGALLLGQWGVAKLLLYSSGSSLRFPGEDAEDDNSWDLRRQNLLEPRSTRDAISVACSVAWSSEQRPF